MSFDLVPTPTMFAHYAILGLYFSIALAVLDRAGAWFGPLVKPRWPGLARFCAAAFGFLSDTFNHVFKPLLPAKPAPADVSKSGFVSRSVLFVIALAALLFIPIFASACAGSQTNIGLTGGGTVSPGGDVSWQVGVNIGVGIARAVIPVAKSAIDSDSRLTPAQHAQADVGLQIATDALPELVDAASALALAPTVPNQCRVHFAAEHVITGALQGVTIAKDAGAGIPPALSMALAGLSTIADMVYPNCIASGAPTMARRVSAQERVQAALR